MAKKGKQMVATMDQRQMTPGQLLAMAAGAKAPASSKNLVTADSFSNFTARLGIQEGGRNQISDSYYNLGPFVSRNRLELEAMYRSSWLVGAVIDTVAEDMTREGISMNSEMKPDDIDKLQVAISEFSIWQTLCSTIKWARLYGGALAVILIDGAKYETPMDIKTIRKDQFKGLVVLDRWMLQPSMGDLITDICQNIGMPNTYEVLSGVSSFPSTKIHHTRVMRFDGIELPYYQKLFENLWGLSVIERMMDRLIAFDSATTGAAQLLYKAYLRVIQIEGLREALATGGAEEAAVIKQFQYIRRLQTNEGITVLDAKDKFEVHQYSFSGISDLLMQFGQQISGSTGIPLVRLFGQSPAGLSATGESDLRNYYDKINKDQESTIRPQLDKLFGVLSKSVLGYDLPEDFRFSFLPLWQLSDTEKSTIASSDAATMNNAYGQGLITKVTALKELKQQSDVTGRFTNITQKDLKDAEDEPPLSEMMQGMPGAPGAGSGGPGGAAIENQNPNERLGGENPEISKVPGGQQVEEGFKETTKDTIDGPSIASALAKIEKLKERLQEPQSRESTLKIDQEIRNLKEYIEQQKETKDSKKKLRFRDAIKKKIKDWLDAGNDFSLKQAVAAYNLAVKKFEQYEKVQIYDDPKKGDAAYFEYERYAEDALHKAGSTDLRIVLPDGRRTNGKIPIEWAGVKDADFKEEEHPRAKEGSIAGQFTSKGSGQSVEARSGKEEAGAGGKEERKGVLQPLKAEPKTEQEKHLAETIKQISGFSQGGARASDLEYQNTFDMVEKLGKFFSFAPRPKDVKQGKMKECYRNAAMLAMDYPEKYTYVEGIAYSKGLEGIPMNHAWCVDKEGQVVDPTWKEGTAYYGIPFSKTFLLKTISETGVWGLIPDTPTKRYNPFQDGFPKGAIMGEGEETKDSAGASSKGELEKIDPDEIKNPEQDNEHYNHIGEEDLKTKDGKAEKLARLKAVLRKKDRPVIVVQEASPVEPVPVVGVPIHPVTVESLIPVNSDGIVYKGYVIKQDNEGRFTVFSTGGVQIDNFPSLELAMNKINEIAI